MARRVQVCPDALGVARAGRDLFVASAREAIARANRFTVALSGGSTPRLMHAQLAENGGAGVGDRAAWERVHVFWGDERHVPPDHPDSNERMARETLLSKVPIPAANAHRIPAENADASRVAEEYERTLGAFFALGAGGLPRLDLVFLGMGPDGHTASLFPGTTALDETERLVAAPWVEKFKTFRITMTAPMLNAASRVAFLVAGADKAETLKAVLEGPHEPRRFPSQLVHPGDGELVWFVDEAAARLLSR